MTIFTYSPTIPNPPDDPADDVSQMQTNSASIFGLIAIDHVGFNLTNGGQHQQVTFNSNNVPAVPTIPPVLFTQLVNGLAQPFFYSGTASQGQNQYVNSSSSGSTFLLGGMILKWGVVTVSAPFNVNGITVTFASPFNNNCFFVSATIADGGTGTTANSMAYARAQTLTDFNLLITLRTSLNVPPSGSLFATYFAIGV